MQPGHRVRPLCAVWLSGGSRGPGACCEGVPAQTHQLHLLGVMRAAGWAVAVAYVLQNGTPEQAQMAVRLRQQTPHGLALRIIIRIVS